MRILQAAKLFPPPFGGIETIVERLSNGLCKLDPSINVDILATSPDSTSWISELEGKMTIRRVRSIIEIARTPFAPAYPFYLRESQADILHFHWPYPWAEFSQLFNKNSVPYIVSYHSDIVKQKLLLPLWKPFMYKFLEGAAKIIVASPHLIEASPILNKEFRSKTEIIPYGLDTKRFAQTPESNMASKEILTRHAPDGKPILFFLGRLVYYKGIHILLAAMQNIDAHLIIGGTGPLEMELRDKARTLGVESKVTFAGIIEDDKLPSYYLASSIFVLPSVACSEAFGLVQLEAHASGIPVVSSNLPTGVTFINQHGETGLCPPASDPGALADSINYLLNNPGERKRMGAAAKRRAILEFDASVMCASYLKLYKNILLHRD